MAVAIPKGPNVMLSCVLVTIHKIRSARSAHQRL